MVIAVLKLKIGCKMVLTNFACLVKVDESGAN